MEEIKMIERQQQMRFEKRKNNLYDLLDNTTKKQIDYIAAKLRFMFKKDAFGQLNAEIMVFQLVSNTRLTLDVLQTQVLRNGQKAASKGLTIEKYFEMLQSEVIKIKKVSLTDKEIAAMNELADKMMN